MAMTSGDRSPPPDSPGAAIAEAVRADLVAIDARVFAGLGTISLDDQLAALRKVALRLFEPADG